MDPRVGGALSGLGEAVAVLSGGVADAVTGGANRGDYGPRMPRNAYVTATVLLMYATAY